MLYRLKDIGLYTVILFKSKFLAPMSEHVLDSMQAIPRDIQVSRRMLFQKCGASLLPAVSCKATCPLSAKM